MIPRTCIYCGAAGTAVPEADICSDCLSWSLSFRGPYEKSPALTKEDIDRVGGDLGKFQPSAVIVPPPHEQKA